MNITSQYKIRKNLMVCNFLPNFKDYLSELGVALLESEEELPKNKRNDPVLFAKLQEGPSDTTPISGKRIMLNFFQQSRREAGEDIPENKTYFVIYCKAEDKDNNKPSLPEKYQDKVEILGVKERRLKYYRSAPIMGCPVIFAMLTRTFICLTEEGRHVTVTETFPKLAPPRKEFTYVAEREMLQQVATSGSSRQACAALAGRIPLSYKTLERRVRELKSFPPEFFALFKRIGIDDFSIKRGLDYCTIIYDLDTHTPLEIVEGATAEVVFEALKKYTAVEAISRDRGRPYEKATKMLSDYLGREVKAVIDKFHVVKNLVEAMIKDFYGCKGEALSELGIPQTRDDAKEGGDKAGFVLVPASKNSPTETKRRDWEKVQELKGKGCTKGQAKKESGLSTYKINKYWDATEPASTATFNFCDYPEHLTDIMEGIKVGKPVSKIFEDAKNNGMEGGLSGFRGYVKREFPTYDYKTALAIRRGKMVVKDSLSPKNKRDLELMNSPRVRHQLAYMGPDTPTERTVKWKKEFTKETREYREMFERSETLKKLRGIVVDFSKILADNNTEDLSSFIAVNINVEFPHVARFFKNLQGEDEQYLKNAMELGLSNGPVEAMNGSDKSTKRRMGNRAKVDYLEKMIFLKATYTIPYRTAAIDPLIP